MLKRTGVGYLIVLLTVATFIYGCPKKQPSAEQSQPGEQEETRVDEEKQRLLEEKKRFEEERKRIEMEKSRLAAEKRQMQKREEIEAKENEAENREIVTEALPDPVREGTIRGDQALLDITFEFNRYDIRNKAKTLLQRNADWLLNNSDVKILIEGHCDEQGTSEYNLALGEKRALVTKKYLMSLGIRAERLHTISYGEELPIDPEHNEAAWSRNRRAHFLITTK